MLRSLVGSEMCIRDSNVLGTLFSCFISIARIIVGSGCQVSLACRRLIVCPNSIEERIALASNDRRKINLSLTQFIPEERARECHFFCCGWRLTAVGISVWSFISQITPTVESAGYSVGFYRHNSTRVDEGRKCRILLATKMQGSTVVGRGEKGLLCDPRSELRLGGREKRSAKIINGMKT